MRRRSNGEGSIYQRKDGLWCGAVQLDGRRKALYGRSRKEVAEKLRGLLEQTKASGRISDAGKMTVGILTAKWLELAAPRLRPTTQDAYQVIGRKYIVPGLGHVRLSRLTPLAISHFYATLAKTMSKRRVESVHGLLHKMLGDAVRWGILASNPANAVDKPKREETKPQLWVPEQVKAFCSALNEGQGGQYGPLFLFLLGSGVRLGEALGLRWTDVSPQGTVRIERQVVQVGRNFHEGPPKSKAGVRVLTLPDLAIAALRQQRLANIENRLRLGAGWKGPTETGTLVEGRVFLTEAGTTPERRNVERALDSLCQRYDLPRLKVHCLRHLNLSLLAMAGTPLKVAQQRAGHSSPAITATIYQHILGDADTQAAKAIEMMLTR